LPSSVAPVAPSAASGEPATASASSAAPVAPSAASDKPAPASPAPSRSRPPSPRRAFVPVVHPDPPIPTARGPPSATACTVRDRTGRNFFFGSGEPFVTV
jgi:hypothetical protein